MLALLACGLAGAVRAAGPASAPAGAAAEPLRLRIVGGLADVRQYTRHEAPFWTRTLPGLTQGRVTAEIVPFDRAGIRGQNMLRLLELGVVPFGTALLGLTLSEDALLGAADLAGLNPDMPSLRRHVAAIRPLLAQHLRQRYGIELLAVYAYPAQVLFCKQPLAALSDLAQRRVRVSSVTQADLVEALGGTAVTIPFAELVPQMRSGALDCAITGTMSGHTIGLHEVTGHLHPMAITWGLSMFAANGQAWAALPADVRRLLRDQLPGLETAIWAEADHDTGQGLACNTGSPALPAATCGARTPGQMQLARLQPQDQQRLRSLLASTVVPRWLARCGRACHEGWNRTLAPLTGITAPAAAN